MRTFPKDFMWGTATSGHQVEGDNSNSDTWFAELVTPSIFMEPSGKCCDSYVRWNEDLEIVSRLNLNTYRFSVEWARVEPEEGRFDEEALDHYEAMVNRCVELGIKPVVTMSHFTAPHWFAAQGSWMNPHAPEQFARFCAKVVGRFGDRISQVVTLNEPNLSPLLEWVDLPDFIRDLTRDTLRACSAKAGVDNYRLSNVIVVEEMEAMADGMTAGHRAARAAIKQIAPDLPVGLSIALMDDRVVGDDPRVRDRKRAETYQRWLELAREDDFVGVQNYETHFFDENGLMPPREGAELTGMGSEMDATSLAGAVRYVYEQTGVPVLVTEHGLAHDNDELRAEFIPESLRHLHDLMGEGVPVIGYTHWTLLDNFEWIFGYTKFYGLCSVDRNTFDRTPKPSAYVYAEIAKANAVD